MELVTRSREKDFTTNDTNLTNGMKTGSRRAHRETEAPDDL
jgi:hypothetical protein